MAIPRILNKKTEVFSVRQMRVGDFDPTKPGCYDNVKTFPIEVRPQRALFFKIVSDVPISIAFANSDNSSVYHKEDMTDFGYGPIPTGRNREMGILLGVYPGDKATIDLDVWMEKA